MGILIVTIVSAVLTYQDIITTDLFIGIVLSSIAWMYGGAALYFEFGLFKFWYHDVLHWHTPDNSPQWFDGCSTHAKCKHCGRDIMQDSQGDWFTF